MIPTIMQGDTSSAITFAAPETVAKLHIVYQGVVRIFENVTKDDEISFSFTAAETAKFRLGTWPLVFFVAFADGSAKTYPLRNKVRVTDAPALVYGTSIDVDPGADSSSLEDVTEVPERFTVNELADKLNEVIRKLGGGAAALLMCFGAFGADVESAPFGNIYNDTLVVTNVNLEGIKEDIETLQAESSLMYRLYSGSNAVMEVTNYNSRVNPPMMRLLQLDDDNQYVTIWTETNGLNRTLTAATNYTDDAILSEELRADATYAPRGWAATTSGLGADAPSNTTWISTPQTVIAGGFEFQRVVTTAGEMWVLCSNGMSTHANTNGYFTLSAADGTEIITIAKTDSYLVGVDADSIIRENNTVWIRIPVVSGEHPLLRYSPTLDKPITWQKEEDGFTSPITVEWSGESGAWICKVASTATSGFFYFEFLQEGGVKIVNNGVVEFPQGILCTDGKTVIRPVNNNGTITWEVVQ